MVVLEFFEDFFHNGFTEKDGLGVDLEKVAILGDGCHFAVVQVDDLAMCPHKGGFLLLQIFRVDGNGRFFLHQIQAVLCPTAVQRARQNRLIKIFRQK